jgi:hypothetical protein
MKLKYIYPFYTNYVAFYIFCPNYLYFASFFLLLVHLRPPGSASETLLSTYRTGTCALHLEKIIS